MLDLRVGQKALVWLDIKQVHDGAVTLSNGEGELAKSSLCLIDLSRIVEVKEDLAYENARLKAELAQLKQELESIHYGNWVDFDGYSKPRSGYHQFLDKEGNLLGVFNASAKDWDWWRNNVSKYRRVKNGS
jgi:hypothetical protein